MSANSIPPSFRLDGRCAVVTGASRRIGLAIAETLAVAGASVLMVARSEERLRASAEGVRNRTGAQIESIAADISSADDATRLIEYARKVLPRVDILVNNAFDVGTPPGQGRMLLETEDATWERAISTNILGAFRLCRAFGNDMLTAGEGSIVNVLSGAGLEPVPRLGPYGATKAALWMMTRYLAAEAGPTVRANAVCPGTIGDPDQPAMTTHKALLDSVPLGRLGTADEVAGAVLYLVSPAASYTTGALITVNGGRNW